MMSARSGSRQFGTTKCAAPRAQRSRRRDAPSGLLTRSRYCRMDRLAMGPIRQSGGFRALSRALFHPVLNLGFRGRQGVATYIGLPDSGSNSDGADSSAGSGSWRRRGHALLLPLALIASLSAPAALWWLGMKDRSGYLPILRYNPALWKHRENISDWYQEPKAGSARSGIEHGNICSDEQRVDWLRSDSPARMWGRAPSVCADQPLMAARECDRALPDLARQWGVA